MEQLNMKTGKRPAGEGQSLVEYGLILSLVAVVSIAGLNMLGNSVSSQFTNIANAMSKAAGSPTMAAAAVPAPGATSGGGGGTTTSSSTPSGAPAPTSSGGDVTSTPGQPSSQTFGNTTTTQTPTATDTSSTAPTGGNPTPAAAPPTQTTASTTNSQSVAVSDGQQGAMLQCSGNDPSCAGNVDQGSTWGW